MAALNYNHLRYFWTIAHAGGLTRAAEQLNLSQSALSVQLQKLEHQLGHALFERGHRRLQLTEAGRIALDHADTVFKAGDELTATLRGRPQGPQQALRIGALPTLSRNFQLQFVAPLLGRADVELVIRSGTMRALLAQLESHEVDVVLANTEARGDVRTRFRNHLINRQPVALVARPGRHKRFRFPQDLAGAPVLVPSLESEIRVAFDRVLDAAGVQPMILAEVDDMAMLRLLARETHGMTLVPPIVVRDELADGSLVQLCTVPGVEESFYAITQQRRFPNALVAELIEAPSMPPAPSAVRGRERSTDT
jgi:LysR family transcriptional activator of nhaA